MQNALWGSEAGPDPAMLATQAVDTGTTAPPASPTHSCTSLSPGHRCPWEAGIEVCGSDEG